MNLLGLGIFVLTAAAPPDAVRSRTSAAMRSRNTGRDRSAASVGRSVYPSTVGRCVDGCRIKSRAWGRLPWARVAKVVVGTGGAEDAVAVLLLLLLLLHAAVVVLVLVAVVAAAAAAASAAAVPAPDDAGNISDAAGNAAAVVSDAAGGSPPATAAVAAMMGTKI